MTRNLIAGALQTLTLPEISDYTETPEEQLENLKQMELKDRERDPERLMDFTLIVNYCSRFQ